MKNSIFKIVEQKYFDRYLFINYLNDEIVGLDFVQGVGDKELALIMKDGNFKACAPLTEIFKRLKNNMQDATDEQRINRAIDLYTHAFIFQDDTLYIKCTEDIKSKHLIFLKGYLDAWEKLKETAPNENWIDGANSIYTAYCELHNLPKLCADDLIYELNKI
jgi:hypothetical protein